MLENGIHIFNTKQEILDQQTLSLDRVENAVIFARDIKKFLIFDATGENYEERDVPGGSGNAYGGQGLGTPKPISAGNSDIYLTDPVGYYVSQNNKPSLLTIYVNDTQGYSEFRVIYDNANNVTREVKVSADGIKDSSKTIETGEVWECRVTLSRDSLDKNTFFWAKLDTLGGSSYDGDGFGVPSSTNVSYGLITQEEITGNWKNNSTEAGDLTIRLLSTKGYKNWRFYYTFPLGTLNSRKLIIQVDDKPATTKTVRSGETWLCEIKAGRFYDDFFFQKIIDNQSTFISEEDFNSKSGYSKLSSGGGSTHKIEFLENGTIFKLSNSKIEVRLLEGMQDEDGKRHGYVKYINSRGSDVNFEWYDRNGNQVTNNVPSVCPKDTVVEIFADYAKNEYVLNFGQSKVINTISEKELLVENNLYLADLQTRFGPGTVEANNLTFIVDSITSNNLNGEN